MEVRKSHTLQPRCGALCHHPWDNAHALDGNMGRLLGAAPAQAVLAPSESMPEDAETVCGWDFERGRDLDGLLDSLLRTGFQATHFGRAVNEVNRMVLDHARLHACMHEEVLERLVLGERLYKHWCAW